MLMLFAKLVKRAGPKIQDIGESNSGRVVGEEDNKWGISTSLVEVLTDMHGEMEFEEICVEQTATRSTTTSLQRTFILKATVEL